MNEPTTPSRALAIIGTAGRDRTKPMTKELWQAMVQDVRQRVRQEDKLVSGGAAWADHLAVVAFLEGWVRELQLFLPAPFDAKATKPKFQGPFKSSASAANFYHQLFLQATGIDGCAQIAQAIVRGAKVQFQPAGPGFGGMYARNQQVASTATAALAYTWGADAPEDGGTLNTWKQMQAVPREHVSLHQLCAPTEGQNEPERDLFGPRA